MPKRIRMISDPRVMFGPLFNTDGEAGGGTATDKPDTPTPKDVAEKGDGKGRPDEDLHSKVEAQQKVNRDLEGKLNTLKDGLKAALGIEDKKADPADLVARLQEQLDRLTHDNLVSDVARRHKITNDDDLALLATARDADAMDKLAARLAPKADDGDKSRPGKPGTPKPDPSQGKGAGSGAVRPTSVAQVMEDRRAAREKTKTNS